MSFSTGQQIKSAVECTYDFCVTAYQTAVMQNDVNAEKAFLAELDRLDFELRDLGEE